MSEKIRVIKEGMYVRTNKGIAKVTRLCDLDNVAWTDRKDIFFGIIRNTGKIDFVIYDDGTVIGEPSFDVIDLIEEGDYVNGIEVSRIYEKGDYYDNSTHKFDRKTIEVFNDIYETIPHEYLFTNDDIKTVVTAEQYMTTQYVVGGK